MKLGLASISTVGTGLFALGEVNSGDVGGENPGLGRGEEIL